MSLLASKEKCPSRYKNIIIVILVFVAILLVEFLLSNRLGFILGNNEALSVDLQTATGNNILIEDNGIVLKGSCDVELTIPDPTTSYYVEMTFEGNRPSYQKGIISIKDDNCKFYWKEVRSFSFNPVREDIDDIPIRSRGKLYAIQIHFTSTTDALLTSVQINRRGICFNFLRFVVMIMVATLIYGVIKLRLNAELFSIKNAFHRVVFIGGIILNLLIVFFIYYTTKPNEHIEVNYPLEESVEQYDGNIRMFDALMKGHFYLETDIPIEETQKLTTLDNPYDISQREGITYLWDYVFYKGQYYRYFGIAPILTFYYPYYYLFGTLPNIYQAGLFFAIIYVLFLEVSFLVIIDLFELRPTVLTTFLTELMLPSASTGLMIQATMDDMYCISLMAAMAFLAVLLFFSLQLYKHRENKRAFLWCLLAGISVVLSVASRPTIVIPVTFFVLPLYVTVMFGKSLDLKRRMGLIMIFVIPVLTGAACIMFYNYLRFGSPLSFGEKYQLTAYDLSKYGRFPTSPTSIWSFLIHYGFHFLTMTEQFPFVAFTLQVPSGTEQYIWEASWYGVFAIPIIWLLFFLPIGKKYLPKMAKSMLTWGIVGGVLILFFDYNYVGVCPRYPSDALMVFVLSSYCIAQCIAQQNDSYVMNYLSKAICIIVIVSTLIGYGMMFSASATRMQEVSPNIYLGLQRFFEVA